jgi:hypothetical protein
VLIYCQARPHRTPNPQIHKMGPKATPRTLLRSNEEVPAKRVSNL